MFCKFPAHQVFKPLMAIALVALLTTACGDPSESSSAADTTTPPDATASSAVPSAPVSNAPASNTSTPSTTPSAPPGAEPAAVSGLPKLKGKATVVLTVKGKPITIEVNGTDAPVTAGNFVDLVKRGFYDGTAFHRVVPGFVAQGGDPYSKLANPPGPVGTGGFVDSKTGKPRDIPLEIWPEGAPSPTYGNTLKSAGVTQPPKLKHTRSAVAMARSQMPDSASSQFYIALDDAGTASLDGDYAVFGVVTQGMDVVDSIQMGDKIDSAKVTQGVENLQE